MNSVIDFIFHKELYAAWEFAVVYLCGVAVGLQWSKRK